ncbi:hypothetical protein Tco_1089982 [Tanacetum coccineum]|uniref:Uncharacterized protein n=1 Tax=Tanacetum coccineum TaxID=301880 RepID=A0ABQ5I2Y6_9ASTR
MKRMINKLKNKVKKESDKECVPRKGKNKEKQLTPEEAAYQEYLLTFPSFHARTTPFKNYKLSFDTGDQIEVTSSKIHDMLGIPVGGYSLFKLDERETGDEFVKEWADQLSPIALKKIRVNDIARKLVESSVIRKAKAKILVLIPETTFVGVESRVSNPETTFVGVESRVLSPEMTFVGVESRIDTAADHVRVLHVPSRYQFADIFTKRLPSALFEEFRTSLSIRCPPAPTAGEC